jgi:hypothetical protein
MKPGRTKDHFEERMAILKVVSYWGPVNETTEQRAALVVNEGEGHSQACHNSIHAFDVQRSTPTWTSR